MNLNDALILLNIDINDFKKYTLVELKQKYRIQALKHHPDKNMNSEESTNHFKKINEAYEKLTCILSSNDNSESNVYNGLFDILYKYLSFNGNKEIRDILLNDIYTWLNNSSLDLLKNVDKETLMELYNYLKIKKYSNTNVMDIIENVLKDKMKNDKLVYLNPSLDDLFNSNVYKLVIDDDKYYIPLWHNELYFDMSCNNELIVHCVCELDDNIYIDENNNVNVTINEQSNVMFKKEFMLINLCDKVYSIPIEKLFFKKYQTYYFRGEGIPQINQKNIYDDSFRSDIIVHIYIN
jgi:hypothetical protein